jgi:hypothetical protein
MIKLRKLAVIALLGLLVAPAIQGCAKYNVSYRSVSDTVRYKQLREFKTDKVKEEVRQEKIDGRWTDMKLEKGKWVPKDPREDPDVPPVFAQGE